MTPELVGVGLLLSAVTQTCIREVAYVDTDFNRVSV